MAKINGYKVEFSIEGQTIAEQERIYQLLMKNLSQQQKDNLKICVTDLIGGKHNIFDRTGVTPDGENCKQCDMISCKDCRKYKIILERKEQKEKIE